MVDTASIEKAARAIHRARYTSIPFEHLKDERQEDYLREARAAAKAVSEVENVSFEDVARSIYLADARAWGFSFSWIQLSEVDRNVFREKAEAALSQMGTALI